MQLHTYMYLHTYIEASTQTILSSRTSTFPSISFSIPLSLLSLTTFSQTFLTCKYHRMGTASGDSNRRVFQGHHQNGGLVVNLVICAQLAIAIVTPAKHFPRTCSDIGMVRMLYFLYGLRLKHKERSCKFSCKNKWLFL